MKTKMFDDKNIIINNKNDGIKEKDEENIDLLITNTYLYTIAIICIC